MARHPEMLCMPLMVLRNWRHQIAKGQRTILSLHQQYLLAVHGAVRTDLCSRPLPVPLAPAWRAFLLAFADTCELGTLQPSVSLQGNPTGGEGMAFRKSLDAPALVHQLPTAAAECCACENASLECLAPATTCPPVRSSQVP